MIAEIKRGQWVFYDNGRGSTYRAIVRRLHRDGSITVESAFLVDAAGNDDGMYQGYPVRLHTDDVRETFA